MTNPAAGSSFNFFLPTNGPLNLVYTDNGGNPPPPVPGYYNFEVVTAPGNASYSLPVGYQGVALLQGGSGSELDVLSGNIGVIDTGSSHTITLGTGNVTVGG